MVFAACYTVTHRKYLCNTHNSTVNKGTIQD
uniref:Uncharacterized protein n=1 Tax=Ciona intestinalis TaxID=7719 RepID=H2XTX0_CIOIN